MLSPNTLSLLRIDSPEGLNRVYVCSYFFFSLLFLGAYILVCGLCSYFSLHFILVAPSYADTSGCLVFDKVKLSDLLGSSVPFS